jgi:hypothetical protein
VNQPRCPRCRLRMRFTSRGEWACTKQGTPSGIGGGCFFRFPTLSTAGGIGPLDGPPAAPSPRREVGDYQKKGRGYAGDAN